MSVLATFRGVGGGGTLASSPESKLPTPAPSPAYASAPVFYGTVIFSIGRKERGLELKVTALVSKAEPIAGKAPLDPLMLALLLQARRIGIQ